eukprot:SAG22_NODE_536_length_9364_cov_15.973988_8_plen_88_part_00
MITAFKREDRCLTGQLPLLQLELADRPAGRRRLNPPGPLANVGCRGPRQGATSAAAAAALAANAPAIWTGAVPVPHRQPRAARMLPL